jgi:tetratricopeptide (TPR) repeat protein
MARDRLEARAAASTSVYLRRLGPAHPDVGMVLHNIGGLAHARGRPADGEPAARRAVCIRAAALGDEHPATAADRAALATILAETGHHDEAVKLLEQALTVFQRRLGATHHETGVSLGSLGTIDLQRGDIRSAEGAYDLHWPSRSERSAPTIPSSYQRSAH